MIYDLKDKIVPSSVSEVTKKEVFFGKKQQILEEDHK